MTRLWSSEEFASHTFPTPSYLVEPIIPQGGIFILHGKPNVGKSQLIMTLCDAISRGEPLFGRWPVRQGPVVVVQADMTGQIQQERLLKIRTSTPLQHVYWVVEEDGSAPFIDITTMNVVKKSLVEAIQEIDPVLVVWDTMRKIHRLPENDSATPIAIFEAAHRISPTATHAFVHHNRKESRDPDAPEDTDEAFMGNVQFKGSSDTTASLKEIGSSPKRVLFQIHKARTAHDVEKHPIVLELDTRTMLLLPVRPHTEGGPASSISTYRDHEPA